MTRKEPKPEPTMTETDLTRLDDQDILALVQAGSRRFERQIRFRDWRELIAAAIVGVSIAPVATRGPLLARAGAIVILAGLVVVVFRLWRARRAGGPADPTLPVADALRAEIRRVDAQIALLRSVAWWYVAPLLGGSVLLVAGQRARHAPWFTIGYTLFVAALGWGIVWLNAYVVRRRLRPKREELTGFLDQLES